ncbi:MAG TPA: DUF4382 domain-containing protein [Deltaproteobacteria bacterium]|jgi:hypothetical protein|nr:DUF4382 domain-containing protein [Deltaproteobacteria bacterium]HOI06343.1 DUF4382 domain-containing protein [Deltaproteobacteria bacterium]
MTKKAYMTYLILFLAMVILNGCSDGSSPASTGTLSVGLTDAASSDFKAVYVTIKQVQVHRASGSEDAWQTISVPNKTYNLLDLINGVIEQLSLSTLESGIYTQMRLILGDTADSTQNLLGQNHPFANYIIDGTDQCLELKVPSGYETGIKLTHEFAVLEGLTTELILDFDVEKSIVRSGASWNWNLKPTIKVMGTVNKAIVSGSVTSGSGTRVARVRITAQKYDLETHKVVVYGSTLTSETGDYQMYLDPGLYTVVVYKDGYLPACSVLMAGSNEDYEQSFNLVPINMGTITLTVTLSQNVQEQVVEVHILRVSPLDEAASIEVKVLNFSQSGNFTVDLPVGTYMISASNGAITLPLQNVATGSPVTLDFTGN